MTVSMPAHVSTNAPAVSLASVVGLRSPNSAKTIPFKNVLDAFETPADENVPDSGEQKTNSQGTASKKALPDATAESSRTLQYSAPQYSAPSQSVPQIPFPNPRPTTVTAELAGATEEAAKIETDPPAPESLTTQKTVPSAIGRPSAEGVEQDHTGSRLTGSTQRLEVRSSTLPISLRAPAPTPARFAMSDKGEKGSTDPVAEKSQASVPLTRASALPAQAPVLQAQTTASPAKTPAAQVKTLVPQAQAPVSQGQASAPRIQASVSKVQAPASPENAVSMNKPVRSVTPVVTSSGDKTQAVRTPAAIVSSQARPQLSPSRPVPAATAPVAQVRVANPTAGNQSQVAVPVAPPSAKPSADESVSGKSGKTALPQAPATTVKPEVAPRTSDLHATRNAIPKPVAIAAPKAMPVPAPSEQTPQTFSAPTEVQRHSAAVQTEKTAIDRRQAPETQPVTAHKQNVERVTIAEAAQPKAPVTTAAPAPNTSTITEPPTAPATQASISPKTKETDSRRVVSTAAAPSTSARTQDQPHAAEKSDATEQPAPSVYNAVPETSANVTQAPLPQNAVAVPDIPEPPIAPKEKGGDIVVAPSPATRIATTTENFAFAARMLPRDITPVHELPMPAKSPLTPVETQVSQPKAAISQPKPATPQSQQPQTEPSSNSKHETQSPAPTERTDTRASKAAEVTQPEPTQGAVTHWSEVSAPQMSEAVYGRPAPELAEASHSGPTLAAQETHVVTPELPKTSSSTEILLHLTGNDQSAAAIRVSDRAGSVSVSVHASDPVLRESLRSNLGELSQQGWKAEVVKPAVLAAQSESQQDSHARGQQSSQQQQQHSSGGERQSQRDRRTPSGIWQQELEQQISSGDAHAGGNG